MLCSVTCFYCLASVFASAATALQPLGNTQIIRRSSNSTPLSPKSSALKQLREERERAAHHYNSDTNPAGFVPSLIDTYGLVTRPSNAPPHAQVSVAFHARPDGSSGEATGLWIDHKGGKVGSWKSSLDKDGRVSTTHATHAYEERHARLSRK